MYVCVRSLAKRYHELFPKEKKDKGKKPEKQKQQQPAKKEPAPSKPAVPAKEDDEEDEDDDIPKPPKTKDPYADLPKRYACKEGVRVCVCVRCH